MCALSAGEVLLAFGAAGLFALTLHTEQLAAFEPTVIQYDVYRVAFDAHTDTLLLLVLPPPPANSNLSNNTDFSMLWLVSLRRNGSEWLEVHRLNTNLSDYNVKVAACDSRVLLGKSGGDTLNVFEVSVAHSLRALASVTMQNEFNTFACTNRDGDTLVALSHETWVSVQPLASLPQSHVPLASVDFTDSDGLLFRGDLMLVADWNSDTDTHAIVSLRASGNALKEWQVLLDAETSVWVWAWALAGDKLVLYDHVSGDLLIYKLE